MSTTLSSEASIFSQPVDMKGVLHALLTILCQENLENVLLNWKIENAQEYMVCLSDLYAPVSSNFALICCNLFLKVFSCHNYYVATIIHFTEECMISTYEKEQ